jgi:hypothetical protein
VHLKVIEEESIWLIVILTVEELKEEDKVRGGNSPVSTKQFLHTIFMANGGNYCLGLKAVGLLRYADVVVLRIPGAGWESSEAKDSFIQVEELQSFGSCFIKGSYHLLEAVAIVTSLNLNWRLCAPNALEGDLKLEVDPADESW